jgi:hypothetical protein
MCCLILGNAILAPAFAQTGPIAACYPKLSRGINFHHLLNWPDVKPQGGKTDYVWPPFLSANYKISDVELSRLVDSGFDFVRVTADPSIFATAHTSRRGYLNDLVQKTVSHLIASGFKVVFDLHPVGVNPDYAPSKLIESRSSEVFKSYANLVERMAGVLKNFPHDRLAFELMNEPMLTRDAELPGWQAMLEELHARARAGAPDLPLVLTGAMWGDAKALMRLDTSPFKQSNVLYTFHYYDPHTFTHQGVNGDEAQFISDLAWPSGKDNIEQVRERALARIAQDLKLDRNDRASKVAVTTKLLSDYLKTNHNFEQIRADFGAVARWASQNGISRDRILLGEFGCVGTSNNEPLSKDRLDWLRAVRTTAQEFEFPWALWAYKGWGGMALADATGRQLDQGVLAALGLSL